MTANSPYAGEYPKLSPFHQRQEVLNVRDAWRVWNGYKFADHYYDAEYEQLCVRNQCATYDICPMQKYEISGSDAEAMLNRMVTRDVTRLRHHRVAYTVWCTDEGRIIDDGTIFRLADDRFMLTCGSPCTAWLRKSAFGFADVSVTMSATRWRHFRFRVRRPGRTEMHGAGGHRERKGLRHQAVSISR
ncbi:MAG: hypothetical protein U5K38_04090 [Woeseiaceae bacterium]|nr:hypothetical protein [Woeseiaceae bacterium]